MAQAVSVFAACTLMYSLVLIVQGHAYRIPALWPGLLYKCTSHKVGLSTVCAASSSLTRERRSIRELHKHKSLLGSSTAQLSCIGLFSTGIQSSTPKMWLTSKGKTCWCTDGKTRPCHLPAEIAASPRAPSWQRRGGGEIPFFPTFKIRGFKIFMLVSFNMVPQSLTLNFLKLPIFKARLAPVYQNPTVLELTFVAVLTTALLWTCL